jgi:hypothetical protein
MSKKFKSNQVYILDKDWADYYSQVDDHNPDGKRYDFCKSVKGSSGCYIADCWICDKNGNIHPGYCDSPVPMNINSLTELIHNSEVYHFEVEG